ncbi:hypothetical protein RN2511_014780 [Rhodococcus sp. NKCM2511]|uniref:hypothetical protein n=1 Tax=Rhodococcus sp. NKCM2511 TaxID=2766011 RepID=UPI0019105BFA|nr:hypothetical protein [Rhodococcus sp. NKCM2511]GHP16742.1 hypothetical protein RN2511_014780 [Rhodococcus sp. NKCM2511]
MNTVVNSIGELVEVREARAAHMRFVTVAWEGNYQTQTMHECPDALSLADGLRSAAAAPGFAQLIPAMQATLRVSSAVLEEIHAVIIEWSDACSDHIELSPRDADTLADQITETVRATEQ